MIGRRVAAVLSGTTSMYPKAGCWDRSTIPKTHTSWLVALPRWYYTEGKAVTAFGEKQSLLLVKSSHCFW